MEHDIARFLKGKESGQSSVREFFNALCRDAAVPPLPKYEAECERELHARNLITDGTVAVAVRGRDWPLRPPRRDPSDSELNDRPRGFQLS